MYARIIQGRVAELFDEMPTLGSTECALIVGCDIGSDTSWVWDGLSVRPKSADEMLADLSQRCDAKRELVKEAMLYAFAVDGATMDGTLADLRAKWQTIADDEAEETMNILMSGG